MFPMAFVFGAVVLVMAGRSSVKMFSRVFAALAVFLLLSTPYIVALSHANDRVMFNDAGRLNYAWEINRVKKWAHWQGEEGVHGTPVHPTRKIHEDPPMYEFGTPFEVTYPPWYNPTYWYDGVKLTVDLRTQASVIARNLRMLLSFLANATGPVTAISASGENLEGPSETTIGPLLTLLCFMTIVSWNGAVVRRIWAQWFLLVPVGAALAAYALLHYEGRYIAPYVVVLWIVLFRSVAVAGSAQTKKVFTAVLASAALLSIATLAGGAGRATLNAVRSLADPNASVSFFQSGYSDWKVVEYLHNAGVSKETRVGAIGWTYTAYWARMAQVHIVAEIPAEGAASFWSSDTATRDAVMDLFRKAGAKAVVARSGHLNSHHEHEWDLRGLPGTVAPLPISTNASISPGMLEKWHHIDGTDYYVFVFPISSE